MRIACIGLALLTGCHLVGDVDGWAFAEDASGGASTTGPGGAGTGGDASGGTGGTAAGTGGDGGSAGGCVAVTDDAFDQFSNVENPTPDGRWSYGSTDTLGGTPALYTEHIEANGLDAWRIPNVTDPNVVWNGSGSLITHPTAPIDYPADDFLHIHPGTGVLSMVRWTAPSSARYRIDAQFSSLNRSGASTGVHVVHEGAPVFSGTIDAPTKTETFSQEVDLIAGDTVDFVVDDGGNGHGSDSTGVAATLTLMCP